MNALRRMTYLHRQAKHTHPQAKKRPATKHAN